MQESNSFYESVYELVKQIPPGQVYTYGRVAWLLGFPQRARMVGTALKNMPPGEGIPAWRVVNASGRIAPGLSSTTCSPPRMCVSGRPTA